VNSLSAHLTAGVDHGRLRFHPDCPICRNQRLAGALCDTALSARAQAGLLAAALGAGSLLPTSVAAGSEGSKPPAAKASQAPVPAPAPEPAPAPDEPSPGADETQEAPIDEAPQVRELLTSPEAGTDTHGEDIGGEDEDAEPAPPTPLGQPPAEPSPVESSPVTPPAPPAPVPPQPDVVLVMPPPPAAELEQPATPEPPEKSKKRKAPERAAKPHPRTHPVVTEQSGSLPVVEAAEPIPPAATVPVSQPAEPPKGPVTGRSYTVKPGDSLWSIARRRLGGSPSAGQIAREVDRLWRLNAERIGTGNPSLIHVGTVLRLG
jgi:nucleoid-associated protein YgaU